MIPASFEIADLLACITLPTALIVSFDSYDPINVERVQTYYESALVELEFDFERDGNPVFAWEAVAVTQRYRITLPDWVKGYLTASAGRILDIRDEVAGGKAVNKEAVRVGKALGFGVGGVGNGGWFKHATMLQRDRAIYLEIRRKLDAGSKLDFAYDDVAKMQKISRSTIVRTFLRVAKLNDETGVKSEGQDMVS